MKWFLLNFFLSYLNGFAFRSQRNDVQLIMILEWYHYNVSFYRNFIYFIEPRREYFILHRRVYVFYFYIIITKCIFLPFSLRPKKKEKTKKKRFCQILSHNKISFFIWFRLVYYSSVTCRQSITIIIKKNGHLGCIAVVFSFYSF